MKAKGLIQSGPVKIAADVVDAVRWQDVKNEEMTNMKVQDTEEGRPWLDDLLEDFVAFDLSPTNTAEEARTILKELKKELDNKELNYGPEARNYIFGIKRELELLIEKM